MNREILFKAKRLDNGEWVEGNLIHCEDVDENCKAIIIPKTDAEMYEGIEGIFEDDLGFEKWYKVDPTTLCQYTGLTDKNGQKIWENDILRGHGNDEDLAKVVFGRFNVIDVETIECLDSVIGWCTEVIETDALSKYEPFCLPMPLTDFYIKRCEYEVCGNIFDNSELLEVE